ncbi:MAG TPA: DUF1015 domain-containing protein [Bryobacteraceae bacterium]|nr:DUF1015 domain-containing protein [Bryobacteraceae bacterium]
MATIKSFQPYRYTAKAGDPSLLITQPYDKISPEMQARYLAASPYNLVRVILGERFPSDGGSNNVYTRAEKYLEEWIREGILAQDSLPGFYAYFQEFDVPDTGERATRQGFIGIGKVEDYSANVVYRHEQTLSGPKKDRRELLCHTRSHFGQIFMLYPDREGEVDKLLEESARTAPVLDMTDEYGARHRVWPIANPGKTARIQELMAPKKLLIADGHHRYETALAYHHDHPSVPEAEYVMMTFVNMYSPGLKILATHRVLRNLGSFDEAAFLRSAAAAWKVTRWASLEELKKVLSGSKPELVRIGIASASGFHLLERARQADEMDVPVLHHEILTGLLGISEEAVRDEKYIHYLRGMDTAAAEVEKGAQVAFLLAPTPIEDMARIAFAGGVMPQKSTDFYPKLLTGVTIYRL